MNNLAWIGIIVWGVFLTVFGLWNVGPSHPGMGGEVRAHDVLFLIAGGLVTCLIGTIGLMGFMQWVPGLQQEQKNYR